ncbi:hypothetical protein HOP50_05g36700 [Chloropicon primus]|uniref:MICOS complex subunit MIC13 n=1 Tax=Chloropicon primus TaxID=1764295 RepID=A0A5B8MP78_9CHLO|nr:hypothetical protein A3770_05p36600 [Chloropicon primus]UPR00356.1 hypothetical protein HOP50_05g36700 [Chloropicon primus]|eukprot:QDZ21142.1 hypothetical protein A3770_05p36600 [Chloropicon primus]
MSYMQRVKVFGLLAGVGSAAGAYYVAQKDLWEYTRELAEALPGVPSLDLVKDTVAPSSEEQHEQHEQSAEAPLLAATESSGPMVDTNAWIQSWNSSVDLIFGKAINALCEKGL